MGRQQYLTRLALGRSPFQDEGGEEAREVGEAQLTVDDGEYTQQYDAKARAINPVTTAQDAELRHAQNSVLALVGVVEEKEHLELTDELKYRNLKEARQLVLLAEQDYGETCDTLLLFVTPLVRWWSGCLYQRYLIGFYDPEVPFAHTVLGIWRQSFSHGIFAGLGALLPGVYTSFAMYSLRIAAETGLDEAIPVANAAIDRTSRERRATKKTARRLHLLVLLAAAAAVIATDVALLPLSYYTVAQQLGLAASSPLFPPRSSFNPRSPTSVHSFGWQSTFSMPLIRAITTPALLLLIRGELQRDDEGVVIDADVTAVERPSVLTAPAKGRSMSWLILCLSPFDPIRHQCFRLRQGVLRSLGWHILRQNQVPFPDVQYENSISYATDAQGRTSPRKHRSTQLARTPTEFLAASIDGLIYRILTMPLEYATLKIVSASYLSSPLAKTAASITAAPRILGSSLFHTPISWPEVANFAGKVGLSLALQTCVEVTLFACVDGFVRWRGIRLFDWGSTSKVRYSAWMTQTLRRLKARSVSP